MSKGGPCQLCKPHERQGANSERRRIRRALKAAQLKIWTERMRDNGPFGLKMETVWNIIDAATRAKRGKRK